MQKNKKSSLANTLQILIVIVFLVFVFLFYARNLNKYETFKNTTNNIVSEQDVQAIVEDSYNTSILNPKYEASFIEKVLFSSIDHLSKWNLTSNFISYINSRQDWVMDCSECALDGSCEDLEKEQFFYPVDISFSTLEEIEEKYKNVFIIDVRTVEKWENGHIPNSVPIPVLDVVPYLYPLDRWSEVIIVGDNYLEKKIVGEALIRLNFHRVYKVVEPVNMYPGKLESINGN